MKKVDDAEEAVDLKATVTLSGEALAALLEEVKNVRAAASAAPPAPEPEPVAEPATVPPAESRPTVRRSSRALWPRFR